MGAADREAVAQGLMHLDGLDLVPVIVDDDTYRQAYDVVANTTLWYVHHHLFDLPNRPRFDRHWRAAWEGYRAYNRAMADAVSARAGDGDTVLVQDYHFSLLGRMLAERRPDLRTVHFLHTPFAEPSMLAVLPDDVSAELLDGMAGYGACGFHCHKWEAEFAACYAAAGRAAPRTFVAPLGPDADVLAEEAASPESSAAAATLAAELGGRRVIARADRMEPSKNIVRGMLAFEELLHAYPQWHGRLVHLAFAYPSRQGLAEYLAYAADVEHTAERINHAFGAGPDGWTPIVLSLRDDRARSLAALTLSDVLLVNPVRDGLNLVAKEGPLAQHARRRRRPLTRGGRVGGARAGRPRRARGEPLRRGGHRRRPARRVDHGATGARGPRRSITCRRRGPDLRRLVGRPVGGGSGLSGEYV